MSTIPQLEIKFPEGLTGAEKVLYRMSYKFERKYITDTDEAGHLAGAKKIEMVRNMPPDDKWVDLTTGKVLHEIH